MSAQVVAVSLSRTHTFSKQNQASIRLVSGLGVEGDAHSGPATQHRWLKSKTPGARNLTQVHLLHAELHLELARLGMAIEAGAMGENVTTSGLALLDLPVGARLHLGETTIVGVTGLREPCVQLNRLQPGLMQAVLERDRSGRKVRKAGIMGIVLTGGEVRPGDAIAIDLPPLPWTEMGPV